MEKIFVALLNMSITAGWIVLALVLLRPLVKKLPNWVGCTLWALVGIRLVLPFSLESILSLIPSVETIPPDIAMQRNPAVHTGIEMLNHAVNPVLSQSFAPKMDMLTSINPLQIVEFVMSRVWILGVIAMILYALVSFISLKRKLRTATKLEKGVYENEFVESPFILSSKIYLPYNMMPEERKYCILHEKAHLKRGDHLIKPLAFLLLSVYWFNPLMWVAFILLCRDIELACDEKVIKELGDNERKEYSLALVKNSISRKRIAACPLAFGEVGVKERVKKVMNYKKPAFWVVVVAIALSVVLAVCLLTNPAGMKITDIEDHNKMLDDVYSVNIIVDDETDTRFGTNSAEIVNALKSLRVEKYPVSQSRSEDRDSTNRLVLRHSDSNPLILCFNADCTEVYIDDGVKPTFSYEVKNPEKIQDFFKLNYIDGIFRMLSSGSDYEGVSIAIKNYSFGDKPYLNVEWRNDTNEELVLDEYFDLLYSNGMGNSFSCAKENIAFKDIAYIFPAHDAMVMTYDLSQFDVSKSGYYTFKVNCGGKNLWIDFIVDYGGFYQDDIIEIQEIENANLSKLFQAGNALSPISSIRFAPVFRIDSKQDFVKFAGEYDFIRPTDGGFLELVAKHCDETIFDNYSFLIAVATNSPRVRVGELFVDDNEMRLSLVTNELYPEETSNWLVITAKPKSELSGAKLTAAFVYEPKNTTYTYNFSPDFFPPRLVLYEDGTGSFAYSAFSSYANFGTYKNNGETIVLTTSDNMFYFTFKIDGERLIFDAENSSEIPKYRYSENGVPQSPVPDGAVFE